MSQFLRTRSLPALSGHNARSNPATASSAIKTFLLHPSASILLLATIGFGAYRMSLGELGLADGLIALILFAVWPVLEWLIHVVLLHNKPRSLRGRQIDFLLPQTHRWHHADPWNLKWVFIPLHIYPLVGPLLIIGSFWLLPSPELAATTLCLYFGFALHYEWVHYLAHINWCPPLGYYRKRVQEHRWHHFRNESQWWGVSRGLADRLFGTAPHVSDTEASKTTGNILGN